MNVTRTIFYLASKLEVNLVSLELSRKRIVILIDIVLHYKYVLSYALMDGININKISN